MNTITIVDESLLGEKSAWSLDILDEALSLRELLRRRIYQEVTEYNAKQSKQFNGLIKPSPTELLLNNKPTHLKSRLDWQDHYQKALRAFSCLSYIVIVDDRQVTSLDEIVELHMGTNITFLKLVPLIGG